MLKNLKNQSYETKRLNFKIKEPKNETLTWACHSIILAVVLSLSCPSYRVCLLTPSSLFSISTLVFLFSWDAFKAKNALRWVRVGIIPKANSYSGHKWANTALKRSMLRVNKKHVHVLIYEHKNDKRIIQSIIFFVFKHISCW